tara:strand:+ start:1101 stop:1376 length:276 start_codon:yes stop_codon:yes gene_type:complete
MGDLSLQESDLRLLSQAGTNFKIIAKPIYQNGDIWWQLQLALQDGKTAVIAKARDKSPKLWRQLSGVYQFIQDNTPEQKSFTVVMKEDSLE